MREPAKTEYAKHMEKDYNYAFKLAMVRKLKARELEIKPPTHKYEILL